MSQCILCGTELSGREPPEHPLLDALGGRLKIASALCQPCNNERLGGGPDRALAESARFLRMMMGFRSGNRKMPPPVRDIDVGGRKVRLDAGGVPSLEGRPPFTVTETDDGGVTIELVIKDRVELERAIPHLAGRLKITEQQVRAMLATGQWTHRTTPVGPVATELSFGGPEAIRSMAKGCLVLWAKLVGEEEIHHARYDAARAFILSGGDAETERLSRLDLRPWPGTFPIADPFGPFANVIYVASDHAGRVLGYFRLYGAIGWCIELAPSGAGAARCTGLASNPENPAVWSDQIDRTHPLEFSWLDGANFDVGFDAPLASLNGMLRRHQDDGYRREFEKILSSTFDRHGYRDDDPIPEENFRAIVEEISMRMAALICRVPINRTLRPNEIGNLIRPTCE